MTDATKAATKAATKSCSTCRHWTEIGTVGSGLATKDGSGEWIYRVGACSMGDRLGVSPTPPEWNSCWYHRKVAIAPQSEYPKPL